MSRIVKYQLDESWVDDVCFVAALAVIVREDNPILHRWSAVVQAQDLMFELKAYALGKRRTLPHEEASRVSLKLKKVRGKNKIQIWDKDMVVHEYQWS